MANNYRQDQFYATAYHMIPNIILDRDLAATINEEANAGKNPSLFTARPTGSIREGCLRADEYTAH